MSGINSRRAVLAVSALLIGAGQAASQPSTTAKPSLVPSGALTAGNPVEFADEPLRLDSVGLSMQVPLKCELKATRGAGVQNLAVVAPDNSWLVNIRTPQTSNPAATIKEAMEQTIKLVEYSVGKTDRNMDRVVETEAQVLEQTDDLTINGQPAARAYVSVPSGEGNKRIVKGYTFFKPSARQFVVFELIVPGDAFNRVRGIYETTLATATFADPTMVSASYAAAVKSGVRLFDQVDPDDYVASMGSGEQFHRLYRPAASGSPSDATELGYRSLKFWSGKRGEVDPDRRASEWKGAELEEGYLCQLTVRLLDGANVIDTVGRYFMSPDRQNESWSVVLVRTDQKGRELGRWQETGARAGKDMRVLVVEPGARNRPVEPFIQGEGYISQFESFLLPSLLMHKAIADGVDAEFGFYSYRSETETISLRRDTVARDTQSGGVWTINTKFRDDTRPQRSVFNEKGTLIRILRALRD